MKGLAALMENDAHNLFLLFYKLFNAALALPLQPHYNRI